MKKETKNTPTAFKGHIVLHEPEIPQNTGNIARTCGALGCTLHLIHPLGFSLSDRYLKRAGLDYWHLLEIKEYPDIDSFFQENRDGHFFFFTKKTPNHYHQLNYPNNSFFIFGKETWGLPETLTAKYPAQCLRIPMVPNARSLNLSNAAAIVLYEAYRQNNFPAPLC